MDQNDYNDSFRTMIDKKHEKLENAFKQVSDIRKFEIELYWKRSAYFWTLISVSFVGYFTMVSNEKFKYNYSLSLIIAAVGLVLTCAWFLANKGSKFWQENWENHLDLLEGEITGPLYKTVLSRKNATSEKRTLAEKYITAPQDYSVSKINQWIGFFIILIWLGLIAFSFSKSIENLCNAPYIVLLHGLILVVALLIVFAMKNTSHRHKINYESIAHRRKTSIVKTNDD